MKRAWKVIILAGSVTAAAFIAKAVWWHRDYGGIEGQWEVASWPEGWKPVPGTRIAVTHDEIKITVALLPARTMHYTADASEGTIDVTHTEGGSVHRQLGRYERQDDKLTVCVGPEGGARPDSLENPHAGDSRWMLRVKK